MSDNLPILWENKVNNPELLAFLEQYGSAEYLTAEESNQMRDAVNELFYKVTQSKIYENNDLQIFRMGLMLELDANEKVVADGVYRAGAGPAYYFFVSQ